MQKEKAVVCFDVGTIILGDLFLPLLGNTHYKWSSNMKIPLKLHHKQTRWWVITLLSDANTTLICDSLAIYIDVEVEE